MNIIKLETKNTDQMNNWIGAVSKLVDNITLTITKNGLEETAKDPAHVCLVDMLMSKDDFTTFNVEEEDSKILTVDTIDLSNILSRVKSSDSIEITVKDNAELSISSENGGTKEFSIPLLTSKANEEQDLSKLNLKSKVGLTVGTLSKELKNVALMGEHVCFKINKNGLTILSSEGQGNYKSELSKNDINYIKSSEENKGTYQINYLDDVLSSLDNKENISLALSNESPLMITREKDKSYIKMVQAPILRND